MREIPKPDPHSLSSRRRRMMSFHPPRKVILTKEQLEHFQASKTHADIATFIETLNEAVVGVKLTDECPESPVREYSFPPSAVVLIGLQRILY